MPPPLTMPHYAADVRQPWLSCHFSCRAAFEPRDYFARRYADFRHFAITPSAAAAFVISLRRYAAFSF